jgi:hypothetical protein
MTSCYSGCQGIRRFSMLFSVACLVGGIAGCGVQVNSGKPNSGGSGTPTTSATGNWQISLTPVAGKTLFPYMSGYIQEDASNGGSANYTNGEFVAETLTGCYTGSNAISGQGQIEGNQLSFLSFSTNGQFLDIYATLDASATTFNGTYGVTGGCAGGAAGTVTATKYASFTGTYSGSIDGKEPAQTIQVTVSQNNQGNGNGYFQVSGSAQFTGFSCFTSGTLSSTSGQISGSATQLTFVTPDSGGTKVTLEGNIDTGAQTLTLSSINVSGGSCSGSYGTATLTRPSS